MTELDLLSKMQEIANKNASVPPALAKVLSNINLFSSVIDPTAYTTCCSASTEDKKNLSYGCNNPYGDGSDPEYVCSYHKEGKCLRCDGTGCKERYSLEEID